MPGQRFRFKKTKPIAALAIIDFDDPMDLDLNHIFCKGQRHTGGCF